ncbi:TadE family protein [Methylobacterium sp. ID0610]|uniref:TadE family protein n=1 Tax=Methylobacterium carpenticola TaxID=3344827 RepID=UPI0036CC5FFE
MVSGRLRLLQRLGPDRLGATAVEFALLLWPAMVLILGALQFGFYQYTQATLSNALFDTAAAPGTEVILGDQAGYRNRICASIPIIPDATCRATLLVELEPLASLPTTVTDIQGSVFDPGLPMNLMVLRAAVPTLQILPFAPVMRAKASVVFRRP